MNKSLLLKKNILFFVYRPLQGGLVGPTFACIIGIQFRQLRKCDRLWYETDDPNLKFTEAQLNEIRKVTLSKIFCENMDNPGDMQRAAFDLPSNFLLVEFILFFIFIF